MGLAHDGRRKPGDHIADKKSEPDLDQISGKAAARIPLDEQKPKPLSDDPRQKKGYVGALRQHDSGRGSSQELAHSDVQKQHGYEGSIRAAATSGATKVGEEKNLNMMAVVVLAAILGLLTCIFTLAIFVVLTGRG